MTQHKAKDFSARNPLTSKKTTDWKFSVNQINSKMALWYTQRGGHQRFAQTDGTL